jgi:hypothetical protein
MASRQSEFRLCRAVRAQLARHQHLWREAAFLEQLVHQFRGRNFVAPSLHKQVENLAFVVNRALQPELPAGGGSVFEHASARRIRGRLAAETKAAQLMRVAWTS